MAHCLYQKEVGLFIYSFFYSQKMKTIWQHYLTGPSRSAQCRQQDPYKSNCKENWTRLAEINPSGSNGVYQGKIHWTKYHIVEWSNGINRWPRNTGILFVDFKKAFDTKEWHFIQNVLECFNFGPVIRNGCQ